MLGAGPSLAAALNRSALGKDIALESASLIFWLRRLKLYNGGDMSSYMRGPAMVE